MTAGRLDGWTAGRLGGSAAPSATRAISDAAIIEKSSGSGDCIGREAQERELPAQVSGDLLIQIPAGRIALERGPSLRNGQVDLPQALLDHPDGCSIEAAAALLEHPG